MSFPKMLAVGTVLLLGGIGVAAWMKKEAADEKANFSTARTEVLTLNTKETKASALSSSKPLSSSQANPARSSVTTPTASTSGNGPVLANTEFYPLAADDGLYVDRMNEFFNLFSPKFPIVETVTYTSRVSWMSGRPAWASDYATHYQTSKHFIARSLNQKPDYYSLNLSNGDQFNVLKKDAPIEFHLVVDLSRLKMRFYFVNQETNERVLVKTYKISAGKPDTRTASGSITPLGSFLLGSRLGVYKPGSMGTYNGEEVEMVRVFGTRWIPFEKAVASATGSAKGLGLHGEPLSIDPKTGELVEEEAGIGRYVSSGCIRLHKEEMEDLFAVIITKPSYIHIVRDFSEAELPGQEGV